MRLTKKEIIDKLIITKGTQKCFIFDLDGTILFNDKPLCNQHENLLKKIHHAGHEIVFASGRPVRDFHALMPEWTHNFNMSLFGGGISLKSGEIIQKKTIPRNNCLDLVEICLKHDYPFVLDDHAYYYHPDKSPRLYEFIDNSVVGKYRVKSLEQILDNDIFKVFILDDLVINKFSEYVENAALMLYHHTKFKSFDILPPGVNKYDGVWHILNHPSNDIFVFGDDLNDYPLFINFHNSVLMGEHNTLNEVVKLNILNDIDRYQNLDYLIEVILNESMQHK